MDWFDTTEAECLRHTEESGYWREGTVLAMLADGLTVSTPSAQYKQKGVERDGSPVPTIPA